MSTQPIASPHGLGDQTGSLDAQTPEIDTHGFSAEKSRRRGWFIRRMLLLADIAALALAFLLAQDIYRTGGQQALRESVLLLATLPAWVFAAKLYGLYDRDEERTDHSTADEVGGVFNLVTAGSWLFLIFGHLSRLATPSLVRTFLFW